MGLRLFETDPEAAPKPRFADDLVGRFRSGTQVNKRPLALEKWRVTTGDPEVARAVHDLFGGTEPQTWGASGEDTIEVFTEAEGVRIIVDGPKALRQEMVLWGRSGAIRKCDGVEQTGEGHEGEPCACPASFAERKEEAKRGTGCQPSITLFFRLAANTDLGLFKFNSGSWSLVREIGEAEKKLVEIDGPAEAWLSLEVVEWEPKGGGAKRRFIKPVIDVLGPAPTA